MLTIDTEKKILLKDGKFFPYLADTAWTLLERLMREEIIFYLDKRKSQGFNAVQVSAISELNASTNREGQAPFFDYNPEKPNLKYFNLLEFLADECEKRDIVLNLLPTWGDKFNKLWGEGPEIFTPENAYIYGKFLAELIGDRENIIFMLGGDRPLDTENHRLIMDNMAKGLKAGERVKHLITYHPNGEHSSADFLADADYIDFHTIQSSHAFGSIYSDRMLVDTMKKTGKPAFDAECVYEDFPFNFQLDWGYRFTPLDIRHKIYKNLLVGAFAHTYGHQSVWCFRYESNEEYPFSWKEALDRPAANQMKHINTLIEAVDIVGLRPFEMAYGQSAAEGKDFILIYAQNRSQFFVDLKNKTTAQMQWFNPENGEFTTPVEVSGEHLIAQAPFKEDGVLIIRFRT